jgi:RNA polymerase sigma factor (sigma-70 family)
MDGGFEDVHAWADATSGVALQADTRELTAARSSREADGMATMNSDAELELQQPRTLEVLVAAHRDFLRFLERKVGDRATAEDILQSAFVRASSRVEQLRDDEAVVAWFYRILRNAVIDHYRRGSRSEAKLDALAREFDDVEQPTVDTQDAICRCVGELLDTLKPEYAEALRLVELEGVAVKDYAEQIEITANNAGVRVFRAREALRKQVMRSCGTCAEHGCVDCCCHSHAHE